MNVITEAQASFIRALVARIEARKVVAPKKVTRYCDPVRAHADHLKQARECLAKLDAGELTKSAASTHISSLTIWANAR